MNFRRALRIPKIDFRRVWRVLMWASIIFSLATMFRSIFGIAGHMVLVMLDTAMGARWAPTAPWVPWAIAGGILGLGPSLWSIPYLRKRKMLVLWVPLGLIITVGLVGCLPWFHARA